MAPIQIENNEAVLKPSQSLSKITGTHRVIIVDKHLQRHELNPCSQFCAHAYAWMYNRAHRRIKKRARAYVQRLEGLGRIVP